MKVDGISKVYGVYESVAVNNRHLLKTKAESKADKLSISSDGRDFQAVMRGLKEAPDIREDRVQELTKKFEDINYCPDYKGAADRMLNSGVFRGIGPRGK